MNPEPPPAMIGVSLSPDAGRAAKWWRLFKMVEFTPQLSRMRACLAAARDCDGAPLRAWRRDVEMAGGDALAMTRRVSARLGYVDDPTGHWLGPIAAYAHGGDCEDHAVAKMATLLAVGVPAQDLFVAVLRSRDPSRLDHAVLAMRDGDDWRYFDMNADGARSAAWLSSRYELDRVYRADGAVFRPV